MAKYAPADDSIPFAVQSYQSDAPEISSQRVLNAYAEAQPSDAKKTVSVFAWPGVDTFTTLGAGPVRGMWDMDGVGYAVSGQTLYSFDELGNNTIIGAGIGGSDVISMDDNGIEIGIAAGTNGSFTYNTLTATFAQILDPDFNVASTITTVDDYFLFPWDGTNKFFASDLLDGQSYDPLLFASAESNSDHVVAVHNAYGNAAVVGEKTIEFFDDTGAIDMPFQRINGATIERGTAAKMAWAEEDNGHFFLGDDRVFYRLSGSQISRLSTHAIEKHWETFSRVDDAFCFVIPYGGHKFVGCTFPTVGETWVYDISNPLWHERTSYDAGGADIRWRFNCARKMFSRVLLGDNNSGKIGYLNPDTYTEFGDPLIIELISPVIDGRGKRGFMPEFQLDMTTGTALATGQGSDPQVMLAYSDDGGHTWSSEKWRSCWRIGQYGMRVRWRSLGSFHQRIMKIRMSDPVKRVIIGARAPGLYFSDE